MQTSKDFSVLAGGVCSSPGIEVPMPAVRAHPFPAAGSHITAVDPQLCRGERVRLRSGWCSWEQR